MISSACDVFTEGVENPASSVSKLTTSPHVIVGIDLDDDLTQFNITIEASGEGRIVVAAKIGRAHV